MDEVLEALREAAQLTGLSGIFPDGAPPPARVPCRPRVCTPAPGPARCRPPDFHARNVSGPVTAPREQLDRRDGDRRSQARSGRAASCFPRSSSSARCCWASWWCGFLMPSGDQTQVVALPPVQPAPPLRRWWSRRPNRPSLRPRRRRRRCASTSPPSRPAPTSSSAATTWARPPPSSRCRAGAGRDGQRGDGAGPRRLPDAGHHLRRLGRRGGERQAPEEGGDADSRSRCRSAGARRSGSARRAGSGAGRPEAAAPAVGRGGHHAAAGPAWRRSARPRPRPTAAPAPSSGAAA